jgi:hypothetical protein
MPKRFSSIRSRTALFFASAQPYGRRKIMSYLSLLFTPETKSLTNASRMNPEKEHQASTASDAAQTAYPGTGSGASNYQLPSGIVSLDHWLDLNA